jgi:hypothetical protein
VKTHAIACRPPAAPLKKLNYCDCLRLVNSENWSNRFSSKASKMAADKKLYANIFSMNNVFVTVANELYYLSSEYINRYTALLDR